MHGMLRRAWGPSARAALLAAALYTLLAIAITYPLVTHLSTGMLRGLDSQDGFEQIWVIGWVQHVILAQHGGFWDAPIFYPTRGAFAYQDTLIPLALITLPLWWLLHNPLVDYNAMVILAYPASAMAMYALALHLCGDRRAAFLAGLIFAFCPYRERHVEHLNQLSAEGIPLIILGFELARSRGGAWRWAGLGGAIVLCTTLSVYYLAFTVLALAGYAGILLFKRQPLFARASRRGVWALGVVLLAEIPLLLPYLNTSRSVGAQRKLSDIVYFSADVRDFLHVGPQSLIYGWTDGLWRIAPLDVRQYLFPGWTAVALALVGAFALGRRSGAGEARRAPATGRFYLALAGLLALLELGPYLRLFGTLTHLPLPYFIVYLLPIYGGFRDIGRYEQVMMAFLAGGAAIGAARLLLLAGPVRARRLLTALTALLVLEYWVVQRPLVPVASGSHIPPVYSWLAKQPPGVLVELPACGLPGAYCVEESTYKYYATYHWHPLVNGGGGFFPLDWNATTATLDTFPAPAGLAVMRTHSVRYIVVHPSYPRYAAALALARKHTVWSRSFDGDLVFLLDGRGTLTACDRGRWPMSNPQPGCPA